MPTEQAGYTSDASHTTGMPKVYLIAQPTISTDGNFPKLAGLKEWGEIKVLLRPGEDPRFNPMRCLKLIRKRLEEFNPETDYIVWAGGDTLAAVMTGMLLMDFSADDINPFDTFRWLRWERGKDPITRKRTDVGGRYQPINVPVDDESGTGDAAPHDGLPDEELHP